MPGLGSNFWAPKAALLLVAIPPGLLVLGRAVLRRDHAASAATAFPAACTVSTLLADDRVASLVGLHDADGGLLFIFACVGAWALAREMSSSGRRLVPPAVLLGIAVTSAVAWLQMTVGLSGNGLEPWGGSRAAALQGNPVFLGALASAALCLAITWMPLRTRPWLRAGLVVLYAGAIQLSGSRVALGPVVLVLGWALVRLGWRHALVLIFAVGLGVWAAPALATTDNAATSRADASSADLGTRLDIWAVGAHAFADHPVFGAGPARFRAVASPRWTLALARAHGPDVLLLDGHDVAVEYLVTTGIVGALLGALWLALALRGARGALLWVAGALAVSWLVQPQGVDTTPLLMIAVGAAGLATGPGPGEPPRSPRWRSWLAISLLPGLLAGGWLLVGERQLSLGENNSKSALHRADQMIGFFPVVGATATEIDINAGLMGDEHAQQVAIAQARTVAEQAPSRPDWWNRLGEVEGEWGSKAAAHAAFARALALNPWSQRALRGLYLVSGQQGDRNAQRRYRAQLCQLSKSVCREASG